MWPYGTVVAAMALPACSWRSMALRRMALPWSFTLKQYKNAKSTGASTEILRYLPALTKTCWIIVQDTLHHLEPIDEALQLFNSSLKKGGKILSVEENGSNIIQRIKLYKYRGNRRIITIWDEKLQKDILIGNENIRSLDSWQQLFIKNGFRITDDSVQYVRYFLPIHYRFSDPEKLLQKEQQIQEGKGIRREYFFFGLNFIAEKK
jgi:SAM-dependent methyltransferase